MDPRDQTFMTIHNLTPDANILFASDSVLDILGYSPDEVKGKSCFDYFHPDEVPFARSVHSRGILLDKAAVLHYARILSKSGQWVSCECCFTVVHNVLVACTSIYFKGEKSERRARDAPQIRRIFSCSPRDPRYHMLEHLSPKFKMPPMEREPRAALILNRFTRSLSIMYATDAVTQILGLSPEELIDRPFYECIQSNCLDEAERCLESAKANESIAYLRFWYKDPRADVNDLDNGEEEADDSDDESDRGSRSEMDIKEPPSAGDGMEIDEGAGGDVEGTGSEARDEEKGRSQGGARPPSPCGRSPQTPEPFELEAVVSCTSDGLVVVLRRARPPIPDPQPPIAPAAFSYENGLFAAPWGRQPIEPYISPELLYTFRPPLLPQYMPLRECVKAAGGPPLDQLMRSIRDVAVFAWAVTGINGTLATYGHGRPSTEPQRVDEFPVWETNSGPTAYRGGGEQEVPKDYSGAGPAFNGGTAYPPGEASIPGYPRPRHASLDERMYDNRQTQWPPAVTATPPYPYGGYDQGQYRRPLRPSFSYDALHDHARYQQTFSPPSPAIPSRCSFPQESWAEPPPPGACISSAGTASSSRRSDTAEASKGSGYFWQ
ncbi:Potassium voltage-dependent transporter [Madurella fahalii]|uniref:Potassium voltage-dependent transporter n=1 Tax=Madurella fahalii TaxID=1157608 RepID=A0ABQ0GM09_9PEZI